MNYGDSGLSASDVALLSGSNGRNNDGFGSDGNWANDGKEEYNRGNYGARNETMRSLEGMLESVTDFIEMLQNDAGSQEEVDMIKHYTRRISEM